MVPIFGRGASAGPSPARRLLEQEIAVVLQDFPYEEWYTSIHPTVPFVDYVPLRQDLMDLEERFTWIKDNPTGGLSLLDFGQIVVSEGAVLLQRLLAT